MTPTEEEFDLRVATLAELGARAYDPAGVRILVEEDRIIYTSIGRTTDEIARRIGWKVRHVWIPEQARQDMLRKHAVIVDPVAASKLILQNPISVHTVTNQETYRLFFADAEMLRQAGHLDSRTTRYVDAIIEERQVENGSVLRLFHLSPRKRNYGSAQLWP